MKTLLRLSFIVPALVLAAPASAHEAHRATTTHPRAQASAEPMHYVTLDRMIRTFAAQAQADRKLIRPTVLAQR